ncbi:MAG: ATP phosphoribosyltransferase, partial [Aggregatilineales bacterium]
MTDTVTLALPSKGAIAEPTYNFLKECGLKIHKPNPRQYIGSIPAIPQINVLFQRVKDVAYKVADGTAHLGITGYDVVCEHNHEDLMVIHNRLGYGGCQLVVAVPEAWIDVENILDLAEVALDFREKQGRNLRVATTYTSMTRNFFQKQQIHHFTMVKADGAIEAAPTLGYADVIVDLVQTGTTLRENHLKQISGGVIVDSQACLVANRTALMTQPDILDTARIILEYMDAALQGRQYYQISVNIKGDSAEAIAAQVLKNPSTQGLMGPG